MKDNYSELLQKYNIEKHKNAGLKGENTRLRKTNAALQEDLNQLNRLLASSIPLIWHDLTKNPDDLPLLYGVVLNQDGRKVYLGKDNTWHDFEDADDMIIDKPTHWCKIPCLKN